MELYMLREDQRKAWMHASSSSSTVADCSSGADSIVPPSLPSLITGCFGLKERKGKRANALEKFVAQTNGQEEEKCSIFCPPKKFVD